MLYSFIIKYVFLLPQAMAKLLNTPPLICVRIASSKRENSFAKAYKIKTDSVQSSSNYLQKLFTKNLLTAR